MSKLKTSGCKTFFTLIISLLLFAFSSAAQSKTSLLKTGIWKGILHRADSAEIAFRFTVVKEKGRTVLYIHNGSENLLVDSLRQHSDSLWIQMPFFASRFALRIKNDSYVEGNYIKNYGARKMIVPFTAVYGNQPRYTIAEKPAYNVTGNWQATFENENELSAKAIGEFVQNASGIVTGTFRTSTGDYRYLEGSVSGNTLQLSGFDGGHAVLFTATLSNVNTLSDGMMYSGLTDKKRWSAFKNDTAKLPDSYEITKMRPGETTLDFRFPSTDSGIISIADERYKGKVVVVQILGSWCPNCMDETAFLSHYYNENKQRGIEIIGLAYERTEDFAESKEALQPFQKRFGVNYPFLVTGVSVSDEQRTEKTLPQLDSIQAFPTTIFIRKNGNVDKIHTGYDGPATGVHFEEFKKEFDAEIDKLLKE